MSKVISLNESREKKETDRRKAMRLMEALSGIDPALLERSEGTTAVFPFWNYGKQLAVCFACVFLGVCAVGVYGVTNSKYASDQSAPMNFASGLIEDQDGKSMSGGSNAEEAAQAAEEYNGAGGAGQYENNSLEMPQEGAAEKSEQTPQFSDGTSNGTDGLDHNSITTSDAIQEEVPGIMTDTDGTPLDHREELTLEAAKEMARIGGYVPKTVPSGYVFESARGSAPRNSYLDMGLCWCKGMDDIMLHITEFYAVASMPKEVYDSFQNRIVDPEKTETYDVHLYEIPYGETVPQEYREIFDHPVFKESDFSLELIKARMKSVADAGDTNTPRGNFAVFYDSGILVEFNGKGSPEEIWEMFQSIEP